MTAVEWFFKQLTEVNYRCINKTFLQNNNSLAGHKLRELLEQAKAMEKEQEERAYKRGQKHKKPLKDSNPINKHLKSE